MANTPVTGPWPVEDIPDTDRIFMRIHETHVKPKDGSISTGAFVDRGDAMSTDWEKYRIPQQTRDAAKKPEKNGVVAMNVGKVRKIESPRQEVEHTPLHGHKEIPDNRAHTDVRGEKTEEVRLKLRRIATWMIRTTEKDASA